MRRERSVKNNSGQFESCLGSLINEIAAQQCRNLQFQKPLKLSPNAVGESEPLKIYPLIDEVLYNDDCFGKTKNIVRKKEKKHVDAPDIFTLLTPKISITAPLEENHKLTNVQSIKYGPAPTIFITEPQNENPGLTNKRSIKSEIETNTSDTATIIFSPQTSSIDSSSLTLTPQDIEDDDSTMEKKVEADKISDNVLQILSLEHANNITSSHSLLDLKKNFISLAKDIEVMINGNRVNERQTESSSSSPTHLNPAFYQAFQKSVSLSHLRFISHNS